MLEILKAIFLFFDAAVYSLVAYAYDLFILIAQLNFNVISVWFEPIVDRCKEAGVKPTEVADMDLAKELLAMIIRMISALFISVVGIEERCHENRTCSKR